jgi:hypothetical protein
LPKQDKKHFRYCKQSLSAASSPVVSSSNTWGETPHHPPHGPRRRFVFGRKRKVNARSFVFEDSSKTKVLGFTFRYVQKVRSSQKGNPSMTQQDQHGLVLSKNSLCSNHVWVGSNSTKIRWDRKGGRASCRILLQQRRCLCCSRIRLPH